MVSEVPSGFVSRGGCRRPIAAEIDLCPYCGTAKKPTVAAVETAEEPSPGGERRCVGAFHWGHDSR